MATKKKTTQTEFKLSIEEFCTRLSAEDSRVELIGAFAATEKAAGRTHDTETAYRQRFEQFINQPA